MDAVTPWPRLIKRLRFLSSLKQSELAQQLGVDQGTVSRWERGVYVPDIPVQRVLCERLRTLDSVIRPEFIEQLPALVGINYLGFERIKAWSELAASIYGRTSAQVREARSEEILLESCLQLGQALRDTPEWMRGDACSFRAIVYKPDDEAVQLRGTPMGRTGFFLFHGSAIERPPHVRLGRCHIEFETYDEICN
jgi:transcriptional regulator with XRE-family HTH domain